MARLYSLTVLLLTLVVASAATTRTVTITPAGQGGTYNTLSAAEAAEDDTGDIVSSDEIVVFEISGDWTGVSDTTATTFDGWTTDATRYIEIRTTGTARHSGVWTDAAYKMDVNGNALTVKEAYTRVIGLQFNVDGTSGTAIMGVFLDTGSGNSLVDMCIVRGDPSDTSSSQYQIGIDTVVADLFVRNCIVYGMRRTTASSVGGCFINAQVANYDNVTVYDCTVGFLRSGAGTLPVLRNCLAQSCSDGFSGSYSASSSNNCSDIASDAPGTDPKTGTVTFVNAAAKNFHLSASDTVAKDQGVDLSGTFTNDIDGGTRSGTFDIGADEASAATGSLIMLLPTLLP